MSEKGARQSAAGAEMAERLVDDLAGLGDVTSKKMFGGYGVFEDGVMFALVDSTGDAFLRVDEATTTRFEQAGSAPHGKMPYWRIPSAVLEDESQLLEWAKQARDGARAAKKR